MADNGSFELRFVSYTGFLRHEDAPQTPKSSAPVCRCFSSANDVWVVQTFDGASAGSSTVRAADPLAR